MSQRPTTPTKNMTRLAALLASAALMTFVSAAGLANATAATPDANAAETPVLYPTVAAAAGAALSHLEETRTTRTGRQLMTGAILRVGDGYVWRPPVRVDASRRAVARLAVDPAQVATYVVHPRTGQRDVDRANDRVTRAQRHLVDDLDPQHRPIFVLTPMGRILAYHHGASVVELASRAPASDRDDRVSPLAFGSPAGPVPTCCR